MVRNTESKPQFRSSPCMMHETDLAYHGFLSNDETASFLLSLLHAERAGAQVCILSEKDAPSVKHKQLLREIFHDERKSCQNLINSLKIIGSTPDNAVGDFVHKCLNISNFEERLQFLNRGQAWVVRKIENSLAKISNADVQKQLREMLEEHRLNINKINQLINR